MRLPLVQLNSQPYLAARSPSIFGQPSTLSFNSGIKIQQDAVTVSISKEAKELQGTEEEKNALVSPSTSIGEQVLRRLGSIANKISELKTTLQTTNLSTEVHDATTVEINALGSEYEQIIQSDNFKKLLEITESVKNTINAGGSLDALTRSLSSFSALLGERFIGQAASGAASNLSTFQNGLASLANVTANDLLNSDGAASAVSSAVSRSLGALDGPVSAEKSAKTEGTVKQVPILPTPRVQETQFVSGDSFALSLRGYSGKGLLIAASYGMDLERDGISQLVIQAPKEEEDKDKEKLKVESPFNPEEDA